ncbi:MAG: hypothetical protein ACI4SP_03520, partial [Eubacteriales bacterium]
LLPSRLCRATSLPDGGMTLSVTLARATSPKVRGIFSLRRRRNFTFRNAENFTTAHRTAFAPAVR